MKRVFVCITVLSFGLLLFSQDQKGIEIEDYSLKLEWKKSDLESLANPDALTDCENKAIEWIYVDKNFSGGKNGVIERTWMAEDQCGNKSSTIPSI